MNLDKIRKKPGFPGFFGAVDGTSLRRWKSGSRSRASHFFLRRANHLQCANSGNQKSVLLLPPGAHRFLSSLQNSPPDCFAGARSSPFHWKNQKKHPPDGGCFFWCGRWDLNTIRIRNGKHRKIRKNAYFTMFSAYQKREKNIFICQFLTIPVAF